MPSDELTKDEDSENGRSADDRNLNLKIDRRPLQLELEEISELEE